jgi:glycosyltransferase involved in cell wall biosynthesis
VSLLTVFPVPPLPEGNAPARCAVGLLLGLRGHGLDVHALAARPPWAPPADPPPELGVEVVDLAPEAPGWGTRLRIYGQPLGELARGRFAERVRERARGVAAVHLDSVETARLARGLSRPAAVHLHYLVRRDRSLGAPWTRGFREVGLFALAERNAQRATLHLVASSPVVAAELRRAAPRAEVTVAPLTLDGALYPRAPLDGPPVAGLIGSAGWAPTRNAVERLLDRVWPLVRRELPGARLLLAGHGMAELVLPGSAAGVEVVGEVESASDFLRGLSVLLYPLGRGSGMKVKVLESIASGLPVVTTPPGAEGIDGGDGVAVETADERLSAATVELLSDPLARRQRGEAARTAFERRYAPGPATEPLAELYRRLGA